MLLLDTNVCIDLLRGRVRGRRVPAFLDCQLPAVVVAELWTGAHKSAARERQTAALQSFLDFFTVVSFDSAAARHYGEIRAELEGAGTPIGPMDMMIAAQARSSGMTLLTGNLAEFRRVSGLKCQAWG